MAYAGRCAGKWIFGKFAAIFDRYAGSRASRDDVLYICTGSQGESRAALARIARGDHAYVKLEKGDHVVFSSREIPGNEQAIANVQEKMIRAGVNLITAIERPDIHTSGHPNRDELAEMYQFIKPRIALPVHGTMRHLVAHAELANPIKFLIVWCPIMG